MDRHLYSVGRMVKDFESYRLQILAAIQVRNVTTWSVNGSQVVVDAEGYEAVRKGVEDLRSRPVVTHLGRKEIAAT